MVSLPNHKMVILPNHKMVGYLFAGQGSQYIGMGKDLYETFSESRLVFERAEEVLGFDLKRHCFEGPQEMLKLTNVSQPAILTVSIAAFEAFKAKFNTNPAYVAGLSLGEYSSLVAAGSLSLEDGLLLVRKRGEIMEKAAEKHPGKMAAILELPLEKTREICRETKAEIANINAPGQIVISGRAQAVEHAIKLCLEAGAKRAITLEVSGGFHSSLMQEASLQLKEILDSVPFNKPRVAVISNYTASSEDDIVKIKENLVCQMYSSVKWEESMRFMLTRGVTQFFEFGPGKVLKGIMRRIDVNTKVQSIEKKEDIFSLEAAK